jgi:hypothetical protein
MKVLVIGVVCLLGWCVSGVLGVCCGLEWVSDGCLME